MHLLKDRGFVHPHASEITPHETYLHRRELLARFASSTAGVALSAWAGRNAFAQAARPNKLAALPGARSAALRYAAGSVSREPPCRTSTAMPRV